MGLDEDADVKAAAVARKILGDLAEDEDDCEDGLEAGAEGQIDANDADWLS